MVGSQDCKGEEINWLSVNNDKGTAYAKAKTWCGLFCLEKLLFKNYRKCEEKSSNIFITFQTKH